MNELVIRKPISTDIELIDIFMELVLRDTFEKNDIADMVDALVGEVSEKKKYLREAIDSKGQDRCFYIVTLDNQVVGTIEYALTGELVKTCTNGEFKDLYEIGTVFVHPNHQGKGIGRMMLNHVFKELLDQGVEEFCLDSGYKTAQKIWHRKFGEPAYHLNDYWGKGTDHIIWRVNIHNMMK